MQKSISISGMLRRSGFKKRSKSRLYRIGSMSVILSVQATSDPAADPRPGPTGIPLSFAHPIKSLTIKKYVTNPIREIREISVSRRSQYTCWSALSGSSPRSIMCCSPLLHNSRKYASSLYVSGIVNSGKKSLSFSKSKSQRSAIYPLFQTRSGCFGNASSISCGVRI